MKDDKPTLATGDVIEIRNDMVAQRVRWMPGLPVPPSPRDGLIFCAWIDEDGLGWGAWFDPDELQRMPS